MLDPEIYSTGSSMQYNLCRSFLNEIKEIIVFNSNESILDVGCGTGKVTAELLMPLLLEDTILVGGDFQNMVDYANKFNLRDRITFKVINIEDLTMKKEWEGSSFDKCFSFFCEHWIKDHNISFSNYFHLLKPGGKLYMILPDLIIFGQVDKEILKMAKWKEYTKVAERYAYVNDTILDLKKFYQNILEKQNFVMESIEIRHTNEVFNSMEEYHNFSKGVSLVIPCLPDKLINSYMDDYTELALKYELISMEKTKVILHLSTLRIHAFKS